MISKFNVGLKSLLHQGLSEPEFYGDLVYKLKKIRGMTDFSDQFRRIIMRYKRIGYNLYVMRQSASLVINPIAVEFAKNKCLSIIWSTEKIPVAWTIPAREHYKRLIFCDYTN